MKVAIVIPYCNEWPQVLFTIRTVSEELLESGMDFEILAVDNWTEEVKEGMPGAVPDRAHDHPHHKTGETVRSHVYSMSQLHPWLTYLRYDAKLSHWNAKNFAVKNTDAEFLWFMDAHVIPSRDSLKRVLDFYQHHWEELNGTVHLPLTYHLLERKHQIYALRWFPECNELHYTFTTPPADGENFVYEVPCMSTCGVLMHRSIYDAVGGWPEELGIYGGGENFLNFTMSVLGMRKFIFGRSPLYHHGDERGYRWNFWDYERNRMIATYLFGGEEFARLFAEKRNIRAKHGSPRQFRRMLEYLSELDSIKNQRSFIEANQKVDLAEWIRRWHGQA